MTELGMCSQRKSQLSLIAVWSISGAAPSWRDWAASIAVLMGRVYCDADWIWEQRASSYRHFPQRGYLGGWALGVH